MKRSQHLTLFSVFVFLTFGMWTSLTIASDAKIFFNEGERLKNKLEDVNKLHGNKVRVIDQISSSFYDKNKGVQRPNSYKPKLLDNDNYQIEATRLSKSNVDICPHGYILDGPAHNALLSPSTVAVQHQ